MTELPAIATINYEGVKLYVPQEIVNLFPYALSWNDFPDFCGAGEGLGQRLVPDTNWGLSMRPACFTHDLTHTIWPPKVEYFEYSNHLFWVNQIQIIHAKSCCWLLRWLRERRALVYYDAVASPIGFAEFMDRPQGNTGQGSYDMFKDPTVVAKLKKVGIYCT